MRVLVSVAPPMRWREAFARGVTVAGLAARECEGAASLWLDTVAMDAPARLQLVERALQCSSAVVVMTANPDEAEAFALLRAGARAYCHVAAASRQLVEIAQVVEHGGVWMPPPLMQRLLAVSTRVAAAPKDSAAPILDSLTAREVMVAQQVARGASNREIAAALRVSERTVKAHLTTIFAKLGVRDRVQLALAVIHAPQPDARMSQLPD